MLPFLPLPSPPRRRQNRRQKPSSRLCVRHELRAGRYGSSCVLRSWTLASASGSPAPTPSQETQATLQSAQWAGTMPQAERGWPHAPSRAPYAPSFHRNPTVR